MGITPSSLYAAFGDKRALFDAYGPEALAARAMEEVVRRLLQGAAIATTHPERPKGCLVSLGASNCAPESRDVAESLAERRQAFQLQLRDRIAEGALAGQVRGDPDELAAYVATAL
jgi:TetR/AcrR family transcriptional regulator, copper-responsive repressor